MPAKVKAPEKRPAYRGLYNLKVKGIEGYAFDEHILFGDATNANHQLNFHMGQKSTIIMIEAPKLLTHTKLKVASK